MIYTIHGTYMDVSNRLRRAQGHLRAISELIEAKRDCINLARQLSAVENAIENAPRMYIQDHIDNCLAEAAGIIPRGPRAPLAEFKEITK